MKIKANGYLRVRVSMFSNLIRFGEQEEPQTIGESLLGFIYSDLERVAHKKPLKEKELHCLHPYFIFCDPEWKESFLENLNAPKKDPSFPDMDDLIICRQLIKELLSGIYRENPDTDIHKTTAFLSRSVFPQQKVFTLLSTECTDDGELWLNYFVSSFEDVLYLELIELIRRKIRLIPCRNCSRLFIPRRINSDYCPRPYTLDGKTCAEIGYARNFSDNLKNDELLQAYTKAYKAHYARMTKPRKRAKNMSREEFTSWYREAKQKLDQARAGLINADEYKEWLKE